MSDPVKKPATRIPPPVPYVVAVFAGWWLDRKIWPLPLDLGIATPLIALGLIAAGIGLTLWTLLTFWRHRTTVNPYGGAAALCTDGPFRYSRNPIYLGDFTLLFGAAFYLQTVWPLLFAPGVWWMIRYGVIRHEEAHLHARFGEAYGEYARKVRRWI